MTAPMIAFGVGCYHFATNKKPPFSVTVESYIEDLEKVLKSITNISKISIEAAELNKGIEFNFNEENPCMEDSYSYFPNPSCHINIEFEIYIPKRVQDELLEKLPSNTNTERFKITTMYNAYYFPVTFVQSLDADENTLPSEGIIVVREFLRHKFKDLQNVPIRFECMGPSPFHADLYLSQDTKKMPMI